MKKSLLLSLLAIVHSASAGETSTNIYPQSEAQNTLTMGRVDAHAPIGVMGDHVHKAGEWMASYRYMNMHMEDLYQGDDTISNTMAASGYMMTPLEMDMDMHMFGLMYAPTDQLTLLAMVNYIETSMTMADATGAEAMTMETSGLADTIVGALYQIHKNANSNAHLGLNVSLPTGDTDKQMANGSGRDQPFPMQLGAGSIGLHPSITYNHYITDSLSWGAQAKIAHYLEENDEGYELGDSYTATAWVAKQLAPTLSLSLRAEAKTWDGLNGVQNNGLFTMNPAMSSAADPDNTGGTKVDALIGLNYLSRTGVRFAIEFGKTLDQDLDGVQLGSDWTATAGIQYAW